MQDRQRAAARDSLGMPPTLTTVTGLDPTAEPSATVEVNGRRSSERHGRYGINLPAVSEVLSRHGVDPAETLVNILDERRAVLDARGNPVLDGEGKPMTEFVLAPKDRALLAAELLQYTRPKLKATEITLKAPELTDDQIEMRLAALMHVGRK